ncbi:MAG: ImmA/IrrE family metallo-endopeptidase [Cyanobacteriota bacterium]
MSQLIAEDITYNQVKRLTNQLLEESDCLELPINIEKLYNYLGVNFILCDDLPDNVDSFLQMNFSNILVNEKMFFKDSLQKRMRFSIAHELGHFILHRRLVNFSTFDTYERYYDFFINLNTYEYYKIEKQADLFASLILVPDDLLQSEFNKLHRKYESPKEYFIIEQLSNIFEVSKEVIKIKLKSIDGGVMK